MPVGASPCRDIRTHNEPIHGAHEDRILATGPVGPRAAALKQLPKGRLTLTEVASGR